MNGYFGSEAAPRDQLLSSSSGLTPPAAFDLKLSFDDVSYWAKADTHLSIMGPLEHRQLLPASHIEK